MAVIRVEIERLTLTGMRRGQRDRVVEAFQRELTRLLAAGGRPGLSAGSRDRVTGGVPLAPTTDPRRLGLRLARSVHATLLEQTSHGRPSHGLSQPDPASHGRLIRAVDQHDPDGHSAADQDVGGHDSVGHDQDRGFGGAR
jgi:hypothetical protein